MSLTAIIIASCSRTPSAKFKNEKAICVKAETIKDTAVAMSVHCSGILTSKMISKLSFKTGGIIKHFLVDEGSFVRKGQILASLDLTEISARVKQAGLAYEKAERDLTRAKNLYADTVLTLEVLQNASSAYDAALETKNIAEFNQRYSQIIAPEDGMVIKKLAEENELTAPGVPVLIFSKQGSDDWIVKAGVSDKDIILIKKGDKAEVIFDVFNNKKFEGTVTQLAEMPDQLSGTFEVEISIKPDGSKFINGLVASANIISSEMQNVALLPPDAVTEADGKNGFIYTVYDESNTVTKVPVTIAFLQNNRIAVREPINRLGKVITKGAAYLEEGSRIYYSK